jgi:hypothetical protein
LQASSHGRLLGFAILLVDTPYLSGQYHPDRVPVLPENSIVSFTCRFACAGDAVTVG